MSHRPSAALPVASIGLADKSTAKSKTYPPIRAGQTVSEALAAIFDHELCHLLAWEDAARTGHDIEGVHQVRVSFRRMRSALSLFRRVLPREMRKAWSARMRQLVEVTGTARDLDVLLDESLCAFQARCSHVGAAAFREAVEQRRALAYARVRETLDSQSYSDFKQDFAAWIVGRAWETAEIPAKKAKILEMAIAAVARELLARTDAKVRELGADADRDDPVAMHRLRIECKKLRYSAEFFYHLFGDMNDFIANLKGLQDVLGVMHDFAVTPGLLDDVLDGYSAPALRAYGDALLLWRSRENEAKKRAFHAEWRAFANAKHPW